MSIESAFVARLEAYSGLSALVSNRIYPNPAPQNTAAPFVTYFQVSKTRFSGFGSDTTLREARFQFDAYAATFSEARAVSEQIEAAFDRWTNSSGTVVTGSFPGNVTASFEASGPTLVHRVMLDVIFQYYEE